MDQYLVEAIDSNDSVVLPALGAFVVKERNPNVISLNEFFKFNSAKVIIDFIAQKEGIDSNDAKNKLKDYVQKITDTIESSGKYEIKGLGTLSQDTNKNLVFNPDDSSPIGTAAKKEDAKPAKTISEPSKTEKKVNQKPTTSAKASNAKEVVKPAPKAAENPKAETKAPATKKVENEKPKEAPTPKVADEKVPSSAKAPDTKKASDVKKEVEKPKEVTPKASIIKESVIEKKPEPTPKTSDVKKKPVITQTPSKKTEKKETSSEKEVVKEKKKRRFPLLWIIIIILLLLLCVWAYMYFMTGMFKTNTIPEEVEVTEQAVTMEDKASVEPAAAASSKETQDAKEAAVNEDKVVPKKPSFGLNNMPINGSDRYFIVVGCFTAKANANKLVKQLKDNGYKARNFGSIRDLHAVAVGSFNDKAEGVYMLYEVRKKFNVKAWLYDKQKNYYN